MDTEGLDASYFSKDKSWEERLADWLNKKGPSPFEHANNVAITRCLEDEETGLRMVVNISADALLGFLKDGRYKNAYDSPVVGGEPRKPSETRQKVDTFLQLDNPDNYYFGAIAIGGTGVRFYGEYCMVLKCKRLSKDTRIFDRNSYDLMRPPFEALSAEHVLDLVEALRGTWSRDVIHMLVLKLLPSLGISHWLLTLGTISDAILHDEEFSEVHLEGGFSPKDVEEVRTPPEDESIVSDLQNRIRQGLIPRLEEWIWLTRRQLVSAALIREEIGRRIVVSSGRGNRWR